MQRLTLKNPKWEKIASLTLYDVRTRETLRKTRGIQFRSDDRPQHRRPQSEWREERASERNLKIKVAKRDHKSPTRDLRRSKNLAEGVAIGPTPKELKRKQKRRMTNRLQIEKSSHPPSRVKGREIARPRGSESKIWECRMRQKVKSAGLQGRNDRERSSTRDLKRTDWKSVKLPVEHPSRVGGELRARKAKGRTRHRRWFRVLLASSKYLQWVRMKGRQLPIKFN